MIISSLQNPTIKWFFKTAKDETSFCVVEGVRCFDSFSDSSMYALELVYITERIVLPDALYARMKGKIVIVAEKIMKVMSGLITPPGIISVFSKQTERIENIRHYTEPSFVLYNVSNPLNVGAIIRTACALSRQYIIMINGCHYHNPKVVQASAGMLAYIKVFRMSWEQFLQYKNQSIGLVGLAASGASLFDNKITSLDRSFVMVGSEAHGLDDNAMQKVTDLIALPMAKECESLNAAVAGSIAMYLATVKEI